MNKNVPLLEVEIDIKTSYIHSIGALYNLEYMPIGIPLLENGMPDKAKFYQWWAGRAIPASRDGLNQALEKMGFADSQELANKSFGLSLSDHYWMKPEGRELTWEEVNFFQNDFSRDVGDAFFKNDFAKKNINLMSPDNTSDGWLRKKWVILNGKRFLLKAGSKPFQQEPFNEVIATKILEQTQDISYVAYDLYKENDLYFSKCQTFVTPETEFVSAFNVYNALPNEKTSAPYDHLLRCAEHFSIPHVKQFLDNMITLDYLILNTDRHWANFGFIRNLNTLRFEGPAPLFDNGTSLWNNELKIMAYFEPSKPFRSTHTKQIRLVKSFERFGLKGIQKLEKEIFAILKQNPNMDQSRQEMIWKGLSGRIKGLQHVIEKQSLQR